MKAIGAALKSNPEIGFEMEKYIMGDGPFHNYDGVQWANFKEKCDLRERTEYENG